MIKPIAYCHTCETTYFVNNQPDRQGPKPIYGRGTMLNHKSQGHDVRPVREAKGE